MMRCNFLFRAGLCFCVLLLSVIFVTPVSAEPAKRVTLGIVPYSSTISLFKTHKPLRDYLGAHFDPAVILLSSTSYQQFYLDGLSGEFDIVSTSSHFVPGLMRKGYVPLVQYGTRLSFTIIVRKNSGIKTPADLRGKRIGRPGFLSQYYCFGIDWLKRNDLYQEENMVGLTSHLTGLVALSNGIIDAVLATPQNIAQLPLEQRQQLESLDITGISFPSLFYMAHERLGSERIARLRSALNAFPDSPEGKHFFNELTAYGGFKPVTAADIEELQSMGELTDKILREHTNKDLHD
jgi:phosphonate transport system substrate-binding protein